jgi:two-component system sporulation sensor kinase A
MKISIKIVVAFLISGLILAGLVFFLNLLTISSWLYFLILPAAGAGLGLVAKCWIADPLQRFIHETQTKVQDYFESMVDTAGDNEIEQLSRVNHAILSAMENLKQNLHVLDEDNAAHLLNQSNLQEKEAYFRSLFEFANDAVFIYDFEGKLIDVNRKACQMLGYSKKELMQIPFLDLQDEEELVRSKAAFQTSQRTGSLRYESSMKTKDGERIIAEVSSSIVDLKKGIMQSVISNITERKQIEKHLKDSEEKFRTFMETANDIMFITNEQGNIIYANAAMIRTVGYASKELIGMPFQDLLDQESLAISKQRRQQLLESGEDIHELVWETKTRKKVIGEMKAVGIFDDDGHFKGMRGVFRDVTDRKKIEQSQRLTQLGRLAADIAHEVKNQLMLVSTRAQIALIHLQESKDVEDDIQTIINQCKRINDVVKRLLQFSRPSKGNLQELDISDSLNFVVNLVEKQFSQGQVEIIKEMAPSLPQVMIDEKQLQEVFVNLLQNAFEAMPNGGQIRIITSNDQDFVRIDIQDTGSGISENDLAHIFDPFFTTKETGTGLGLSACFGIVQAHQGQISYSSAPGEGTTATIMLPISAEKESAIT